MTVQPRLLDHPFYQAWTRGEISPEVLSAYHRSYATFIGMIPSFWQSVVDHFQPDSPLGNAIIQEERDHILLWEAWGKNLPLPQSAPPLQKAIDTLARMTPSQLLGALQAFEVQQPEVARTKREGLLQHYACREEDLRYFDEHQKESKHITYGSWLARQYADPKEFEEGFAKGAQLVYESLNEFIVSSRSPLL